MADLLCPVCPVCGEPPLLVISVEQAICHATGCPAITWNMLKTGDENLGNINFVNVNKPERDS